MITPESPNIPSANSAIELRQLNHLIELENNEAKNILKTCCGTTSDKRLLVFVSSFTISMFTALFACIQLIRLDDCHSQNTYTGLLTLIIGLWIRSPIS